MKSFDVKIEKSNANYRYRRLQKITTLFRFMEMFVFLVMISRFSFQLPFAVKVSGDYFTGITFTGFSHKFVFVIGNVIILILFLKSRGFEDVNGVGKRDLYDEYVESCERSFVNGSTVRSTVSVTIPSKERKICRSRSENLIKARCKEKETNRKLSRSVTEISRSENLDHGGGGAAATEKSYAEDQLSGEDFRRTVEAFIARQQKMLRDEEFAPMEYVGA